MGTGLIWLILGEVKILQGREMGIVAPMTGLVILHYVKVCQVAVLRRKLHVDHLTMFKTIWIMLYLVNQCILLVK